MFHEEARTSKQMWQEIREDYQTSKRIDKTVDSLGGWELGSWKEYFHTTITDTIEKTINVFEEVRSEDFYVWSPKDGILRLMAMLYRENSNDALYLLENRDGSKFWIVVNEPRFGSAGFDVWPYKPRHKKRSKTYATDMAS